jgi:hypothetical protein
MRSKISFYKRWRPASIMTQSTILIIKTGDTFDDLIRSSGDFEDWIRQGLGVGEDQVRMINAPAFEVLPRFAALCSQNPIAH